MACLSSTCFGAATTCATRGSRKIRQTKTPKYLLRSHDVRGRLSTLMAASEQPSLDSDDAEWQSLRLSKQKLIESLGGSTMRNIDGRRISISAKDDGSLLCTDSEGNTLTTRIDPKTKLILADLSSAVIVSERPAWERCLDSTGFAGLAPETVNGRVAMVAIMLVMGVEVVTQKSLFAQFIEGGEAPAGLLMLAIIVASYAPIFNGTEPEKTFPSLKSGSAASYNFWSPDAERRNGRMAMLGLLGLFIVETGLLEGHALL